MANPQAVERPFLTQLLLFLVALACGVGVWVVTQLTETEEQVLQLAVRAANVPADIELTLRQQKVPVKFSYPAAESVKMREEYFSVTVDFGKLDDRMGRKLEDSGDMVLGRNMVTATAEIEMLKRNIIPVEFQEPQVTWEARRRWARARVEPNLQGVPAKGFVVDARYVEDSEELVVLLTAEKEAEMRARGDMTVVLSTDPVAIEGRAQLLRQQVNLLLPPGTRLLPGESPYNRTLVVDITEEVVTTVLEKVPVAYEFVFASPHLRARVEPPTLDIVLKGRRTAVEAITPAMIAFGLYGVREVAGESQVVKVDARLRETAAQGEGGVLIEEVRPREVLVVIERAEPTPTPAPTATPVAPPPPATPSADDKPTS